MPHPVDYPDNKNVNIIGFPFEDHGFSILSINDDSYQSFLSYKIESELPDKEDISFAFNALFPKFDSIEKINLYVSDNRWDHYLTDKSKEKREFLLNCWDIQKKIKNVLSAKYINKYVQTIFIT